MRTTILLITSILMLLAPQPILAEIPHAHDKDAYTWRDFCRDELEFNRHLMLDAYKSLGAHDPKWDADANKYLSAMAEHYTYAPMAEVYHPADMATPDQLKEMGAKVFAAGCRDPLVQFCYGDVLTELGERQEAHDFIVRAYRPVTPDKYPPLLVAMVAHRRLEYYIPSNVKGKEECEKRMIDALASATASPVRHEDRRFVLDTIDTLAGNNHDRAKTLADALASVKNPDPWLASMIAAQWEIWQTSDARGDSSQPPTDQAWAAMVEHMKKAREHLSKALYVEPKFPEAAQKMIDVSVVDRQGEQGPRYWFERAIVGQFDYYPAYAAYRLAISPGWGGTDDQEFAFGVECLDTGRFDTDVPFQLLNILERINERHDHDFSYWRDPVVHRKLTDLFQGLSDRARRPEMRDWYDAWHAAVEARLEAWPTARRLLDAIPDAPKSDTVLTGFYKVYALAPRAISEVYARTGPQADALKAADESAEKGDLAEAMKQYQKIASALAADDKALTFARGRIAEFKLLIPFGAGQWVKLQPDHELTDWAPRSGFWDVGADGSITLTTDEWGLGRLICPADFGRRYELECEVDLDAGGKAPGAGLLFACAGDDSLYAALVHRSNTLLLRQHTNYRQDFPVKTYDTNVVHVTVKDEQATITVNGVVAVSNLKLFNSPAHGSYVGLAAQYAVPGGEARFRNLKIRKLKD